MKAHDYAKLLLKGPNLELFTQNNDYENGADWYLTSEPRVITPEQHSSIGPYHAPTGYQWDPSWGDSVLVIGVL